MPFVHEDLKLPLEKQIHAYEITRGFLVSGSLAPTAYLSVDGKNKCTNH